MIPTVKLVSSNNRKQVHLNSAFLLDYLCFAFLNAREIATLLICDCLLGVISF